MCRQDSRHRTRPQYRPSRPNTLRMRCRWALAAFRHRRSHTIRGSQPRLRGTERNLSVLCRASGRWRTACTHHSDRHVRPGIPHSRSDLRWGQSQHHMECRSSHRCCTTRTYTVHTHQPSHSAVDQAGMSNTTACPAHQQFQYCAGACRWHTQCSAWLQYRTELCSAPVPTDNTDTQRRQPRIYPGHKRHRPCGRHSEPDLLRTGCTHCLQKRPIHGLH